jgi:hypothetical protein
MSASEVNLPARGSGFGLTLRPQNMNRLIIGSPDKTNFILQFLAEDFPSGLILIDPTGDLARAAANIIPVADTERAFYFDPADTAHPAGFNVLEGVPRDKHSKLTEDLCAYFEGMWPNGWGAQSNYILANCLRVLLVTEGSTLLGVLKLLTDKAYRMDCLPNCADPVVLANWAVINAWDKRQEQTAFAPLLNKIGSLLMSPTIRNIIGQKASTFSLGRGQIIIADLDRAKLGDLTARLLGGLLTARSSGQVYINNVGFFASDYLASLFSQDRFAVALNFLAETGRSPALTQALLSIADKTILRTNRKDAEELSFYVNAPNPRKLIDLPDDQAMTPLGVLTPRSISSLKRLAALRKRSRARHTRPRKTVEARIIRYLS